MTQSNGKLFIISAPSGAGKTSLARALVANNANISMSVSHTTRRQRGGEEDGKDYHFVDEATFLKMIEEGLFLEYAQVYGNYYGTARSSVESLLSNKKNVLLDIDWQGARNVRKLMPQAVSISILPPSTQELEARLRSRGSDSDSVIKSRMAQAITEMAHCDEADLIVLNDDFNEALNDLTLILDGESDSIRPLTVNLDDLLAGLD